jgi:hypothetical protein
MLNLFLKKLPMFDPWLFGGVRVALLFSLLCCGFFFLALCFVPNVDRVSGLSTLYCTFGFL